jgi:hypothetical protein
LSLERFDLFTGKEEGTPVVHARPRSSRFSRPQTSLTVR